MTEEDPSGAPKSYRDNGIMMMIAGTMNTFLALFWTLGAIGSLYGACCCVIPLGVVFVSLHEIYTGIRMYGGQKVPHAKWVAAVGAAQGLLMCFGIVPFALELIVFSQVSKPEIEAWLRE